MRARRQLAATHADCLGAAPCGAPMNTGVCIPVDETRHFTARCELYPAFIFVQSVRRELTGLFRFALARGAVARCRQWCWRTDRCNPMGRSLPSPRPCLKKGSLSPTRARRATTLILSRESERFYVHFFLRPWSLSGGQERRFRKKSVALTCGAARSRGRAHEESALFYKKLIWSGASVGTCKRVFRGLASLARVVGVR